MQRFKQAKEDSFEDEDFVADEYNDCKQNLTSVQENEEQFSANNSRSSRGSLGASMHWESKVKGMPVNQERGSTVVQNAGWGSTVVEPRNRETG